MCFEKLFPMESLPEWIDAVQSKLGFLNHPPKTASYLQDACNRAALALIRVLSDRPRRSHLESEAAPWLKGSRSSVGRSLQMFHIHVCGHEDDFAHQKHDDRKFHPAAFEIPVIVSYTIVRALVEILTGLQTI